MKRMWMLVSSFSVFLMLSGCGNDSSRDPASNNPNGTGSDSADMSCTPPELQPSEIRLQQLGLVFIVRKRNSGNQTYPSVTYDRNLYRSTQRNVNAVMSELDNFAANARRFPSNRYDQYCDAVITLKAELATDLLNSNELYQNNYGSQQQYSPYTSYYR